MKLWKILLVVAVAVLVAVPSQAEPTGNDIKCVADTTLSFTTGLGDPVGPSFIDVALNGTAALKLIWFKDGATARTEANIAKTRLMFLRDYTPPRSTYFPSGPDSGVLDLVTATEALVIR